MDKITRIIVNADDCGLSKQVDNNIEKCIRENKISSTTVLANMEDFAGAVQLYKKYNDIISFGWHINLTEGMPLMYSQLLLDEGYYVENDSGIYYNGKAFWRKLLKSDMLIDIKKELKAQYEKIRDYGIEITHVDGHHHIHTAPSLLFMFLSLFKELRIERCRHIKNYKVGKISYIGRQIWALPFIIRGVKMPDYFTSYSDYYANPQFCKGKIAELECHPGHNKVIYQKEMDLIFSNNIENNQTHLITYKDF